MHCTKPFLEKYVHVTTPEVYGSTDGDWIKGTITSLPAPLMPSVEQHVICTCIASISLMVFRWFSSCRRVYGPGQQLYRIIPRTLLSVLTGEPMHLHGGGHSVRSFIHIKDVDLRATLQLAKEGEPGTTWHLSTKESCSIKNLVELICDLSGASFKQLVRSSKERLGKDQSYLLDSSAMRQVHGWSDQISLHDGLQETLAWVDANLAILKTLPWSYQHKS